VPGSRYLLLAAIGIFPFLVNGPINARLAPQPPWYWSFELAIWVVAPIFVLLAALRLPGCRLADLGFHDELPRYRGVLAVAAASLVFAPVCYLFYDAVYGIFESAFPGGGYFSYEAVIPETGLPRYAVIAYFALSAGFVEEFLFRGLLYTGLRRVTGPRVAVMASAVVFGVVHPAASFIPVFVLGVSCAIAYARTRSLWAPITLHAVYNAGVVLL
jgi:membrane protease YdiL (CAAX protease family)